MIELAFVAVVAFLLLRASGVTLPGFASLSLDQLSRSGLADRLGIDNSIPPALQQRARGLGVVAGTLLQEVPGLRVTSAWRTPALTEAIHDANRASGLNQAVLILGGPGDHDTARGLDVAPTPGTLDHAVLLALRDAVLRSSVGALVNHSIVEQDHVHLGFDGPSLDKIGETSQSVA